MKIEEQWAELFVLVFLVLGFFIAVLVQSPFFSYCSILLAGLLAGRIFYIKKTTEPILPFVLIIVGFLLGYLLGGFWISRVMAFILFVIAFVVSYYLHLKKILVIFKSERFIK